MYTWLLEHPPLVVTIPQFSNNIEAARLVQAIQTVNIIKKHSEYCVEKLYTGYWSRISDEK